MPTNWLTDNFVASTGTLLTAHTADTGETWSAASDASGTSPKFFTADGGPTIRLRPDNAAFTVHLPSSTPPAADMEVVGAYQLQSNNIHSLGMALRHQTSGKHLWIYRNSTNLWRTHHAGGPGPTTTPDYTDASTFPCTQTLRARLEGSTVRAYLSVNGGIETPIFQWVYGIQNDTSQIGAIQPGLLGGGSTASDNVGFRFTSISNRAVVSPATINVVNLGDSLTRGVGAVSDYTSFPSQLCRLLDTKYKFTNLGWDGQTSTQIRTNVLSIANGLYDGTRARNIATLLIGTNDVNQSVPNSTIQTNTSAMHASLRTTGFKTIAISVPYYSSATTPQRQQITDFNTWLAANWNTFADAYYDLNAAVGDPVGGTNPNFYTDGTHLTDTGYGVFAAGLKVSVEGLLAPTFTYGSLLPTTTTSTLLSKGVLLSG